MAYFLLQTTQPVAPALPYWLAFTSLLATAILGLYMGLSTWARRVTEDVAAVRTHFRKRKRRYNRLLMNVSQKVGSVALFSLFSGLGRLVHITHGNAQAFLWQALFACVLVGILSVIRMLILLIARRTTRDRIISLRQQRQAMRRLESINVMGEDFCLKLEAATTDWKNGTELGPIVVANSRMVVAVANELFKVAELYTKDQRVIYHDSYSKRRLTEIYLNRIVARSLFVIACSWGGLYTAIF